MNIFTLINQTQPYVMTFANTSVNNTDYQPNYFKGFINNNYSIRNNKLNTQNTRQHQSKEDRDKSENKRSLLAKISLERSQGAVRKDTRSSRDQYVKSKVKHEGGDRSAVKE